jgi:hypothetical protein
VLNPLNPAYLQDGLEPAERDALLDRVAREVTRRRLEAPAILVLEMHRPLMFLGSQFLILFTPMLGPAFGLDNLHRLTALLQDRANLDRLLDRIDEQAAERDGRSLPDSAVVFVGKEPS